MLILSHPAGLWALLALPVVVLIHFLQERSRKVRTSTLFLLERVSPESVGGARFERLRNSLPLWMQLLSVLLLAWIFAGPRWIKEDSRQTVAVVLDSSVSMSAFKTTTRAALAAKLRAWAKSAAQTEWHLMESNPRKPVLYAGSEMAALLSAYDRWEPTSGTHLPDDALLTARGLVKGSGIVIYVTDHKADTASDIAVLSVGEPIENVGFAGAEVSLTDEAAAASGMRWKVLVKNYGRAPQTREWWVEDPARPDAKPTRQSLTLGPGQALALNGESPPDLDRAVLRLSGDLFTWDDQLPLQRPKPRLVNAEVHISGRTGGILRKMLGALDHVALAGKPDLVLAEMGEQQETDSIVVAGSGGENTRLDATYTVAEEHPLTRDLNWMGLLTPKPMELTVTDTDVPLLWKGDRALALLRADTNSTGRRTSRLMLAWDLAASNADRNPAMLVMLQRFVEKVRDSKREPWAGNFETSQRLDVAPAQGAADADKATLRADGPPEPFAGRSPERPGFFEVQISGHPFISGAAAFADTREADFSDAAAVDTVDARRWEAALKQSVADPLVPLWVLLLLGCLLASWAPSLRSRSRLSSRVPLTA